MRTRRLGILFGGLAVLVALPLIGTMLPAPVVPQHLAVDGFSFDVCYPPGELPLHRIWPSAVPGAISVEYRDGTRQHGYTVENFTAQPYSLDSTGQFVWTQPVGETPVLTWPDGRVLASVLSIPGVDNSGDQVLRLRQCAPLAGSASAALAPPLDELRFTASRPRPAPEMAATRGTDYVELYSAPNQTPEPWYLAECSAAPGHGRGTERQLAPSYMYGHIWLDGVQTLALVTDDARLLAYDFARHDFAEQPQLATMARQLHQHGAADSEFWLGDGFALCFTSTQERLIVAADGRTHPLGAIHPLIQRPDGSRRSWLPDLVAALRGRHTAATQQADFARHQRQWVAEGHRVRADAASEMFKWQALVDPQTIAIFDSDYRRITLVRLATQP